MALYNVVYLTILYFLLLYKKFRRQLLLYPVESPAVDSSMSNGVPENFSDRVLSIGAGL